MNKQVVTMVFKWVLSLVTAVACWEIILEVFFVRFNGIREHPVIGLIPAIKPGVIIQAYEGYARIRINALGLRGPELLPKRPNEVRVLVVGDSYTAAFHVAEEMTFCGVAQERAGHTLGKPVTVINAGIPSLNAAYYLHLAPVYRKLFAADLTVIQVGDSDFSYNPLQEKGAYYVTRRGPGFETVENPHYVPSQFQRSGWFRELSIVNRIGRSWVRLRASESPDDKQIRGLDTDPEFAAATAWTVNEFKNRFSRVVLLHIPSLGYLDSPAPIPKMERMLTRCAHKSGLDLLAFRDDFEKVQRQERRPIRGFNNTTPGEGHLNEFGHAVVGQKLADYIVARFRR